MGENYVKFKQKATDKGMQMVEPENVARYADGVPEHQWASQFCKAKQHYKNISTYAYKKNT